MVEGALRAVVREALHHAAERGLAGNHHFYVTFRTTHPGVQIPEYLHGQYPGEMTIVLQHQFFGLDVEEDRFGVTLSFNNVHERLIVPYTAITSFADPSVNFSLQFQPHGPLDGGQTVEEIEADVTGQAAEAEAAQEERKRGEVVTLDAFRKKH